MNTVIKIFIIFAYFISTGIQVLENTFVYPGLWRNRNKNKYLVFLVILDKFQALKYDLLLGVPAHFSCTPLYTFVFCNVLLTLSIYSKYFSTSSNLCSKTGMSCFNKGSAWLRWFSHQWNQVWLFYS